LEKVLLVPARLIIIAEHFNETWFRARASVCNKWVSISASFVATVAALDLVLVEACFMEVIMLGIEGFQRRTRTLFYKCCIFLGACYALDETQLTLQAQYFWGSRNAETHYCV
jgi:hypothetical protein